MKNILVPIDFSQHSKAAFETAFELASRIKARLDLFHVVENPKNSILLPDLYLAGAPDNKNFNDRLINLAKEKMQKWVNARHDNVELSTHASVGNLSEEFKKHTKANPPDLIVMGVKGFNEKNLNTIGSFTEKMIKKLDFPILAVKSGQIKKDFKKIVMVADFVENEASIAFEIKRLNKLFDAPIEILRINTPQDFESDALLENKFQVFLDKYLLENCGLVTYNHFIKEEGIILAAKKLKADLIAIASQSKNILERLIPLNNEKNLGEDFIDYLEYPIWMFRPNFKLPAEPGLGEDIKGFKFF